MTCGFRGLTVGIVFLASFGAVPQAFCGEPVLDRLEKAIREQVGRNEAPEPVPSKPVATVPEPQADAAKGRAGGDAAESGFLGAVTDDRADRGRGIRVLSVRPQGPADKGGLQANDLIVAIADRRVRQQTDFSDVLALFPPGDTIGLDVQRDGKTVALKVTLGRRPADAVRPQDAPTAEEVLPKPPVLNPPAAMPPAGDEVSTLRRRVTELEKRVADLEQALSDLLNRK